MDTSKSFNCISSNSPKFILKVNVMFKIIPKLVTNHPHSLLLCILTFDLQVNVVCVYVDDCSIRSISPFMPTLFH